MFGGGGVKTYLGDGAYADFDGTNFVLSAGGEDAIYLEPEVLGVFLEYVERSLGVTIIIKKAEGAK